ncbi:hypothetical protein M0813_11909 [Anaeramoeba flamelloides]|uniref:Uncharacterized protein n=1 Tax=Anaeramoeba flamelloides TaxID=1746091 RepID=A0ABQ8ZDU1_9EUKA|nr:hypothetical protein M0813_11909 [Anaeramoeba flamelloides]
MEKQESTTKTNVSSNHFANSFCKVILFKKELQKKYDEKEYLILKNWTRIPKKQTTKVKGGKTNVTNTEYEDIFFEDSSTPSLAKISSALFRK